MPLFLLQQKRLISSKASGHLPARSSNRRYLCLPTVHRQFPVQNWLRLGTWVQGRLEAVADVENTASRRVLEKAGFAREVMLRKYIILKGKARDGVIYSRLAADPKQLD